MSGQIKKIKHEFYHEVCRPEIGLGLTIFRAYT